MMLLVPHRSGKRSLGDQIKLVREGADGIDVGAVIEMRAQHLLRRHVVQRAELIPRPW